MIRIRSGATLALFLLMRTAIPVVSWATPTSAAHAIYLENTFGDRFIATMHEDTCPWSVTSAAELVIPAEPGNSAQELADGRLTAAIDGFAIAASDDPGAPTSRPQSMTKLILVLVFLGGIVRFLTSATYYKFVSEVLDPRNSYDY